MTNGENQAAVHHKSDAIPEDAGILTLPNMVPIFVSYARCKPGFHSIVTVVSMTEWGSTGHEAHPHLADPR